MLDSLKQPLVTVIVPLYNKGKYIESTLKSVVNQSYTNLEILLIDDGSTDDGSLKAASLLSSTTRRFKIYHRENSGQAATRNFGAVNASGSLLAFLDADDVWHPNKIELQVRFLDSHKEFEVVLCNYFMMEVSSLRSKAVRFLPLQNCVENWLTTSGYGGLFESTSMIRTLSFRKFGYLNPQFDGIAGLDLVFQLRAKNSVGVLDEYLCGYRVLQSGAHNEKGAKKQSFESLINSGEIYFPVRKKATFGFSVHVALWQVRQRRSLYKLMLLVQTLLRFPILGVEYAIQTSTKLFFGKLRLLLNLNRYFEIRRLMK